MAASNTAVVLTHAPTLTRVETHRVMAVIEKAVERLQLLAMLDEQGPDAKAATAAGGTMAGGASTMGNTMTDDQGRGVGGILEEQKQLEARYEELINATQKRKHNPMDPLLDPQCFSHVHNAQEEEMLNELRDVSKRLKEQSRILCRQLKDNPNDADNWRKIVAERAELASLMSSCVREMQTSAMAGDVHDAAANATHQLGSYEQFAKKVLEEQVASQWAEELVKKEQQTNQNVKQLQNEVKHERAMKEEELEKRHRLIADLKTELRILKQGVKEQMDKLKAETEAETEAQQRGALDVERQLNERLMQLRALVRNEVTATSDMKVHIDCKIEGIEDLTAQWNDKNQMQQKTMETQKHNKQQERNDLAARLHEKLGSREAEEFARKSREEEQKRRADNKAREEALANAKYAAATKLQASIKGFFTRAILTVLKKKAGKKRK